MSLGVKVSAESDLITIQRGLYKRLVVSKEQLKGAFTIERRFLGGWCVVVHHGGKAHRFKHATKQGAQHTYNKLAHLTRKISD